jgi:hypothetical protein
MKKTTLLIPLILLMSACGPKPTEEQAVPTEPIVPAEGIWTLSGVEAIEDTCNASSEEEADEDDQTASLSLALTDDGFTFTSSDGTSETPCTLDENEFTCTIEPEVSEGGTFTLISERTFTGIFSSEIEASVNFETILSCEGPDCPVVEEDLDMTLPCSVKTIATATADE